MSLLDSKISLSYMSNKDGLRSALEKIPEVIDIGIEKLLENKVNKQIKIESNARRELRNIFIYLFCGLCAPKIPASVVDCEARLKQWKRVDEKFKPNDEDRENFKNIAIKGKKNKVSISFEKFLLALKNLNGQHVDVNVVLYLVAVVESILLMYLRVGIDYQRKTRIGNNQVLLLSTLRVLFAKYCKVDDATAAALARSNSESSVIHDSIRRVTRPFARNSDQVRHLQTFARECRDQLEIILKVFRDPVVRAIETSSNSTKDDWLYIFGKLDEVFDSLGFIVEALEDSNITGSLPSSDGDNDGNRRSSNESLGLELTELVVMDVFNPFEQYVNAILKMDRQVEIDQLLHQDYLVSNLVSHYNYIIQVIFGKSSRKRRGELMAKYHLLHSCEVCKYPGDLQSTTPINLSGKGWSPGSSPESRDSSPYLHPPGTLSGNCGNVGSTLRNGSTETLPLSPVVPCNLLINCFRYLVPRLLLYPVFQFFYLFHALNDMSLTEKTENEENGRSRDMANLPANANNLSDPDKSGEDGSGGISNTNADDKSIDNKDKPLTNVVRSMMMYTDSFDSMLQELNGAIDLEFERCRSSFRLGEYLRISTKESNQKLEEMMSLMRKENELSQLMPYRGSTQFIMEGPVQFQQLVLGKNNQQQCQQHQHSQDLLSTSGSPINIGGDGASVTDRYLYLFNNVLFVCKKAASKRGATGTHVSAAELRLKTKIALDQFSLLDEPEKLSFLLEYIVSAGVGQSSNSCRNGQQNQHLQQQSHQHHMKQHCSRSSLSLFSASNSLASSTTTLTSEKTVISQQENNDCCYCQPSPCGRTIRILVSSFEEKRDWLASLLMLQTHKLFSQFLAFKNSEEIPLRLPDPSVYRFAKQDSEYNIEYEQSLSENSSETLVVRAATLDKLVEHVTSHTYVEPRALNSLLLMFRYFASPAELLEALSARFDIPDPDVSDLNQNQRHDNHGTSTAMRVLKRFRTSYKRKVQLRVVNCLHKWVTPTSSHNHRYFEKDFLADPLLLQQLLNFLSSAETASPHLTQKLRAIRKQIDGRLASFERNSIQASPSHQQQTVYNQSISASSQCLSNIGGISSRLCTLSSDVTLLNVHPVALAQQITLREWRLYSKIEFWEVHSRETTSEEPNFLQSVDFSNRIMHWLVYQIVRLRNLDDRITAIIRLLDLMTLFEEHNNLQGAQECRGAFLSSSVFRLKDTLDAICNLSSGASTTSVSTASNTNISSMNINASTSGLSSIQGGSITSVNTSSSGSTTNTGISGISSNSTSTIGKATRLRRYPYRQIVEQMRQEVQEGSESYTSQYRRRVHSIVAPAIPYIAMGDKTNLIHMDMRNPTFIERRNDSGESFQLINFAKFRQMADLIEHYLSFQKIPYSKFVDDPLIQEFLDNLNPFQSVGVSNKFEFDDLVHRLSLEIQPRVGEPPEIKNREMTEEEINYARQLNDLDSKTLSYDDECSGQSNNPPPLPPKPSHIRTSSVLIPQIAPRRPPRIKGSGVAASPPPPVPPRQYEAGSSCSNDSSPCPTNPSPPLAYNIDDCSPMQNSSHNSTPTRPPLPRKLKQDQQEQQ